MLSSLDERFDAHLAQAENLSALFVALNDEVKINYQMNTVKFAYVWKGLTCIFGGAYYRREIYVSKLAGLIIGGKFVSKFLNVQLAIFWEEICNKLITLKMPSLNTTAINFIRTKRWYNTFYHCKDNR